VFVLRPSSRFRHPEPRPVAKPIAPPAETPSSTEPYIDPGLPIPETYEMDIVRALLQDPFRMFIYWEVREESLRALTSFFSTEEAATFRVVLKLTDVEGRDEVFFEVGRRGRYWMMVFPDRQYQFEIGVRSPLHGYIMLTRSNRVRTPRGTVAPVPAPEPGYKLTPVEFLDVVAAAGFAAEQSLTITLAAAGEAEGKDEIASIMLKLPEPVRDAMLIAASGGSLTAETIERLPEPVRTELLKLLVGSDGQIASLGLMHYLPEILREVIEDERELIGDHLHPVHIAPKFFMGGTENVASPPGELRWPGLPRRRSSADLIWKS
jgi:uncharacterized protein DUF4912